MTVALLVVGAFLGVLVLVDAIATLVLGDDQDLEPGEPWDPRTPWCGNRACGTHTWRDR